jgi:hypothetical protein
VRQNTNELRAPAGSLIPLDFGSRRAADVFAPLPYRDLGAVSVQFVQNVEQTANRLGGAAEIQVGEGRQDAPVGTTLALIEQATKIESEVHKGLHAAQAEELRLLRDLFIDDPSSLWRGCKSEFAGLLNISGDDDATEQKRRDIFVYALNRCALVPASDPNTPSHTHRTLKLGMLKQVQMGNPNIDGDTVDKMIVRGLGFDAEALWRPPQSTGTPMPDPLLLTAQAQQIRAQSDMADSQTKAKQAEIDAQIEQLKLVMQQRIAALQVQREAIIHAHDTDLERGRLQSDHFNRHLDRQADLEKHRLDIAADVVGKLHAARQNGVEQAS